MVEATTQITRKEETPQVENNKVEESKEELILNPEEIEEKKEEKTIIAYDLYLLYNKDKHTLKTVLIQEKPENKKYSSLLAIKLNRDYFIELEKDLEENKRSIEEVIRMFNLKENEEAKPIKNIALKNYIYMYKKVCYEEKERYL